MEDTVDTSDKLVLEYNGDSMEHYREYFDSRIEVLEWHMKQYERKIEYSKEKIKKFKSKKFSLDNHLDDWDSKIQREKERISNWENIIEEHIMEPIGWLYEIKHNIMKID